MPTIEVNGTGLEYTERGAGEPVVFVQGGLNDLRAPAFASTYRTVAYSCRSHYPNEHPPAGVAVTLDTPVDDLVGYLPASDLAPAHLTLTLQPIVRGGVVGVCVCFVAG